MSYHEKGYHRVPRVVATLLDGRTVAKGVTTEAILAGSIYVTVTIPNLNFIEEVIHIETHTQPGVDINKSFGNKTITGNVVGITIADVAGGTTLTVEIIAIGV